MIGAGGLMTVGEVGEFLRLSRPSVYALLNRGELPSCLVGRRRRIPRQAVVEFAGRVQFAGRAPGNAPSVAGGGANAGGRVRPKGRRTV